MTEKTEEMLRLEQHYEMTPTSAQYAGCAVGPCPYISFHPDETVPYVKLEGSFTPLELSEIARAFDRY